MQLMVRKDKSGLPEILFALRTIPTINKKLAYKRYTVHEPNTIKRVLTNTDKPISETQAFVLRKEDFESGQDSSVLMRRRSRGTKLEAAYKKRKGVLLENSNHTITFLPAGRSHSTIISKRDIGRDVSNQPSCSK